MANDQSVGFVQQGSVDWVAMGNSTVSFTYATLVRMSKAGVEAHTVHAALLMFRQFHLSALGQKRLQDALQRTRAFSSFNNLLSFGFDIKHIVRDLANSAEGLSCVGICSCLAEQYSTNTSARVLQELFKLHGATDELTPPLRQWQALMEACQGTLASSDFGLTLHQLSKGYLKDGFHNATKPADPKNIAKILKLLLDVMAGKMDQIHIVGGADCAWIAAIAHWLFNLSVEVRHTSQGVIYSPGPVSQPYSKQPKVVIIVGDDATQSQLTQRYYVLPPGDSVIASSDDRNEEKRVILTHGRLKWSSCLTDAFGEPMRRLLTSEAELVGACLGSAAVILEADIERRFIEPRKSFALDKLDQESKVDSSPRHGIDRGYWGRPSINKACYGRGFILTARSKLPEIQMNTLISKAMEISGNKSYEQALETYHSSFKSLRNSCLCPSHAPIAGSSSTSWSYCLISLVNMLCHLIQTLGSVVLESDLMITPTFQGMNTMYNFDNDSKKGFECLLIPTLLGLAGHLFAGRMAKRYLAIQRPEHGRIDFQDRPEWTAASAYTINGLCFYLGSLRKPTTVPEEACVLHLVPGSILWNGTCYRELCDMDGEVESQTHMHASMKKIWKYQALRPGSSPGLQTELVVREDDVDMNSLYASYRITAKDLINGPFMVGPSHISEVLDWVTGAHQCHREHHHNMDWFCGVLIEGEGKIEERRYSESFPYFRVVGDDQLALWIILSHLKDLSSWEPKDRAGFGYRLKAERCIACTVTHAKHTSYSRSGYGLIQWIL